MIVFCVTKCYIHFINLRRFLQLCAAHRFNHSSGFGQRSVLDFVTCLCSMMRGAWSEVCSTLSSFTCPPLAFVWAGEKSTKKYWHDLQIKAVYSKEGIVTTVIFYHYWTVFEISSFLNRKLFMCREYTIWFVLSTPFNITTDFLRHKGKSDVIFFNVHCNSWIKSNITFWLFFLPLIWIFNLFRISFEIYVMK